MNTAATTPILAVAADVLLVAVLLAATWTDLRTRRIYDGITLPALAVGLLLAFVRSGFGTSVVAPGLQSALAGAAVGWGAFAILVVMGWMGGGDAKLMAAVGAFTGFPAIVGVLLFVVIAGGALGILALLARTGPGRQLATALGVRGAATEAFGKTVPYAPAILLGTIGFRFWLQLGSAAAEVGGA